MTIIDKEYDEYINMVEKASEIVAAILPTLLEGLGWIAEL